MGKAIARLSFCLLLVVGCLGSAGSQDAERSRPAQQPSSVEELLACLDRAAEGLHGYTVTGATVVDGKTQQFKMAFLRPKMVRIDTKDGQVSVQPNGAIKGRLGRGPLGKIAQTLSREDKRLQDAEGIPFYESDFLSMLARIESKVKAGAVATMQAKPTGCQLELRSGETVWRYRFSTGDYSLLESSRWVNGKQVETSVYTQFRPNAPLTAAYFKF